MQQGEEKNTLTLDTEVERLRRENGELRHYLKLIASYPSKGEFPIQGLVNLAKSALRKVDKDDQ